MKDVWPGEVRKLVESNTLWRRKYKKKTIENKQQSEIEMKKIIKGILSKFKKVQGNKLLDQMPD